MPEYTTPEAVLARLRLRDTDPDAVFVAECADAANALVDNWLALDDVYWPPVDVMTAAVDAPARALLETRRAPLPGPPYPAAVARAATGVAVRIYRFKDSESDVASSWADAGVLRIPRDPLAGYVDLLGPYRSGAAWCPA